jgi:hypothetical protein
VHFGEGVEHGVGDGVEEGACRSGGAASHCAGDGALDAAACVGAAGAEAHLGVPVGGFEEEEEDGGAAEDGVEGAADDEAVEGPGAAVGEVGAEAVAADVGHVVLFGEGWDGACWEVAVEGAAKEDKVGEASTDTEIFFGKGLEVGLLTLVWVGGGLSGWTYMCSDAIRDVGILGAVVLFHRCINSTFENAVCANAGEVDWISIVASLRLVGIAAASSLAHRSVGELC